VVTTAPVVLLDTNVIVSLLDPTDGMHGCSRAGVSSWEARGSSYIISTITWSELKVGALVKGDAAERALNRFREAAIDDIVPVCETIAATAARLRARDRALRLPDALIVATAHDRGADALLTAEKRLSRCSPELVHLIAPG
jgi:predicted nucleic acid-binding protein